MKKLGKKGIFELAVVWLTPFILAIFIFFVIIMVVLAGMRSCSIDKSQANYYSAKSTELNANLVLLNLLQTPALVEGINLTFADLGILTLYESKYNSLFESDFKKISENLGDYYSIEISKGARKREFGEALNYRPSGIKNSIEIPAPDKEIVTFTLYHLSKARYDAIKAAEKAAKEMRESSRRGFDT